MPRRVAAIVLIVSIIIAIVLATQLGTRPPTYTTHTRVIMATPITVIALDADATRAAEIVFRAFETVDIEMSEWKPDSPLTAVNNAAGQHPVEVPSDLIRVVERGIEIGDLTDGAFDITWAALWGLWDFKAESPEVPSDQAIQQRVALIDYHKIQIDRAASTLFLPRTGMVIGLGGIAKGTALNDAAAALRNEGIHSFLISAGGQVMVGDARTIRPWRVGIRDPDGSASDYIITLKLANTTAATSGDYERFFEIDGTRYHHILDPRTGKPTHGPRSATVICQDAELADALSTSFMILGIETSLALVETLDGIDVILIDNDGSTHMSAGAARHIQTDSAPD